MVVLSHAVSCKKKLSLLFLLVLLPLVSAVQIDSGTIIQSVGLNTTLNFTATYYADVIQTESSFIYFQGFRSTDAGTETVTVNMTNQNMTGIPPYISASTSTSKTITSTLSQSVNASVIVNASCPNLYGIYQGNSNLVPDSCNGNTNQATFTLNNIPSGESNFTIAYAPSQSGSIISGGGGQSLYFEYNKTLICNDVYYFLVDHWQNNGSASYTDQDVTYLLNDLTTKSKVLVSKDQVEPYLNDFSLCKNYTSLRLPTPPSIDLRKLNLTTDFNLQQCSPILNSTFLGYDMDTALPFWKIYSGDLSCDSIDNLRWLFEVERDQQGYAITGIKAWFLILGLLIWLIGSFIKSNGLMNKAIKRINQ